jgi:hypothetical protein
MYKLLINLLTFEALGMMVLLIIKCFKETAPFITFLFFWIQFFIALNRVLGASVGDEIKGIGLGFSNVINLFKFSVGDLQDPTFDNKEESKFYWVILGINIIYAVIIYIETLILNNFLIAKVSSEYENF